VPFSLEEEIARKSPKLGRVFKSDGAVSCYPVPSRSEIKWPGCETAYYGRRHYKKSLFPELEKTRNHVLKNFGNGLHKIKETNKALTVQIINYVSPMQRLKMKVPL